MTKMDRPYPAQPPHAERYRAKRDARWLLILALVVGWWVTSAAIYFNTPRMDDLKAKNSQPPARAQQP